MSKIRVTAGADRRVPLPDGRVVLPGDIVELEEHDALVYRLLDHGDLVRVADAPAPGRPQPARQEG